MADDDIGRYPLIKARVIGGKGAHVMSQALDVDDRAWQNTGAIIPPYEPATLCRLLEHSNALRPNIDAYSVNIDGFGHRLEPVLDLDADDADEIIRTSIIEEQTHRQTQESQKAKAKPETETEIMPSDDEIDAWKARLGKEMAREKSRLDRFFEFCCADESFISLRRRTRQDLEVIGYAFWEILRNPLGEIVEFSLMPAFTVRLRRLGEPVEIEERIRTSATSFDTRTVSRRLRTYVQRHENKSVYFKAFADPRVVSAKTGAIFKTVLELKKYDADDRPATELLYFRVPSPRTSYGIPRWIGTILSVLGSREAEEVNHAYFENKSIPPLMITVSGGRLSEETVKILEQTITEEIAGKGNFHKILILEGEPYASGQPENAGRMRIDVKPLTGTQHTDAHFSKYDERNIDKIGSSFRLPRLLRGDVRDFNRGTAQASLEYAEAQVFAPERDDFDWLINRKVLADMGIRFWRFASNGPVKRDPRGVIEDVRGLVKDGILTPEEARAQLVEALRRELKKIDADWVKQPIELTLAGIPVETGDNADDVEKAQRQRRRKTRTGDAIDEALAQIELAHELREIEADGD